jgi:hypothetical protein
MDNEQNPLADALAFTDRLDEVGINYELKTVRPGALMIVLIVPGERIEVEFFVDGEIEVETFRSTGVVPGGGPLEEILARGGD